MKKHFYHHLITIDTLHVSLGELDLTLSEKQELLDLIEDHIHHTVFDTVLSELNEDDKKLFLSYVSQEKHDDIWTMLKEKIVDSEEKIIQAVESLKKELHEDVKQSHAKK